jgi:WD40 repeat protein
MIRQRRCHPGPFPFAFTLGCAGMCLPLRSGPRRKFLEIIGLPRSIEQSTTTYRKRAVSASGDQTLKVWDLNRASAAHAGRPLGDASGVAVTPDSKRAVSESRDSTLNVWDLDIGHGLCAPESHSGCVSGIAVAPDGRRAVSASHDGTLKVWDLDIGRAVRTLECHSFPVADVAVTPDGTRAVSASWDTTLKVWDLETGRLLRTLENHSWSGSGMAVTPDGKRTVSASHYNMLNVWAPGDLRTKSSGLADTPGSAAPADSWVLSKNWIKYSNVFFTPTNGGRGTRLPVYRVVGG